MLAQQILTRQTCPRQCTLHSYQSGGSLEIPINFLFSRSESAKIESITFYFCVGYLKNQVRASNSFQKCNGLNPHNEHTRLFTMCLQGLNNPHFNRKIDFCLFICISIKEAMWMWNFVNIFSTSPFMSQSD